MEELGHSQGMALLVKDKNEQTIPQGVEMASLFMRTRMMQSHIDSDSVYLLVNVDHHAKFWKINPTGLFDNSN